MNKIFSVRSLSLSEVDKLLRIAIMFFYESDNKILTIDSSLYRSNIIAMLNNPQYNVITAWDGDKISGYVIVSHYREYTVENIGEVYQMYITPEYRGTYASRLLVAEADNKFKEWDCKRIYVGGDTGIEKSNKLFANLWKKAGYFESGVDLRKELN